MALSYSGDSDDSDDSDDSEFTKDDIISYPLMCRRDIRSRSLVQSVTPVYH